MQKLAVWNVGEIMSRPTPTLIHYNKTNAGICLTESFPELLHHPPPLQKKWNERRSFTPKLLMLHGQQWTHTAPLWAVVASTHCKWDKHWQTIRFHLKGHFTFTKSKGAFVKSENIASECFLLTELVGNVLITKHWALKDEGISEINALKKT